MSREDLWTPTKPNRSFAILSAGALWVSWVLARGGSRPSQWAVGRDRAGPALGCGGQPGALSCPGGRRTGCSELAGGRGCLCFLSLWGEVL